METIKISLNKPIYETEALRIKWSECSENNGVLSIVLEDKAGYSVNIGDFIRFERFVTIENENPYGKNVPDGFEYSHVGSVAYDDLQVISKTDDSHFEVTAPKREDLYVNPNNSGKINNGYTISFKTNHDFFYQDIEYAASRNAIKLNLKNHTESAFTFSATTTYGDYNGVPSTYTKKQQSIGGDCGGDEEVSYDYYFLPTRESRFNIRTTANINWLTYTDESGETFYEDKPLECNQNVYYFKNRNGKVTPWSDGFGQTETRVSKYVGYWNVQVPFESNNDYSHLYQEQNINELYTEKIKKNIIPDFINMERVKYKPVISGETMNLVSGLTFNFHFRERTGDEWHIDKNGTWNNSGYTDNFKSDGLYYLGFEDNDVRYQKMKVQKSFVRLSFYRSGDESREFNPLNASLLYHSTIFLDSGELFGKFSKKRIELIKNGDKWEEDTDTTHVLSASVAPNSTIRVDSQLIVYNEFNSSKSSEGFNVYLFADDAPENGTDTIYMKVEFNHAGYGRTIPMTIARKGLDMDNYYEYLYIPLKIIHIDNEYYYAFNEVYENIGDNIFYFIQNDTDKRNITFNLYEPKIVSDGKNI